MTDRNQVIFLVELASTVPAVLAMQVTIHGRRGTPLLSPPQNQNCSRLLFIIRNPDFDTSSFSVDMHVQHGGSGRLSKGFPISFNGRFTHTQNISHCVYKLTHNNFTPTESPDLLIKITVPSVVAGVILIVLIIAITMIPCIYSCCNSKRSANVHMAPARNVLLFWGFGSRDLTNSDHTNSTEYGLALSNGDASRLGGCPSPDK